MMRFAHPEYLHFLWLLIPLVLVLLWSQNRWRKKREQIGDEKQRQRILPSYIIRNSLVSSILILLSIAVWIIALAQPQYGNRSESVKKSVSDLYLAIDVSQSMLARDVQPNRLERTKLFSFNLIQELGSERISIIPFAGHAYVNMPLTTDMAATRMILQSIDENTASTQGTAISEAIELAIESANSLKPRRRIMIILTDGENHDDKTIEAAEKAAEAGITIFTVGVGTEEGSPVPISTNRPNQYLRDNTGQRVISRYNPRLLSDIASETDGKAYQILSGSRIISDIKETISSLDTKVMSEENFEVKRNYYYIFVLCGILFILIALYIENYRKKNYDE